MSLPNIEEIKQEALAVVEENKFPTIASQKDFVRAGDVLKLLKNRRAKIEDKRKEITDPLNKQVKVIKAAFDTAAKPIDDAIEHIDHLMKLYYAEEKKRLDNLQSELDEQARKSAGKDGAIVEIVNDVRTQKGELSTTTMRTIVRWRVAHEAKIPREYLTVDEKKINEVAKAKGMKASIEGIEFYEDLSITSR